MPARLAAVGEVFADEVAAIGSQTFASVSAKASLLGRLMIRAKGKAPRSVIVPRVVEILMDGKPRDIYQLLAEGKKRKLFPADKTWKALYADIDAYIERQASRGRKPRIVEDWQHLYRINEPPDDWPDLVPPTKPAPNPAVEALCARLVATATGKDTVAFEVAVCDAFARFGFKVEHMGGHAGPDGIADAILGPMGYRVLLEAKTAEGGIVTNAHPVEVAKFREICNAQLCVMVGPAFPGEFELSQELQTHKVTALELVDLDELLRMDAKPTNCGQCWRRALRAMRSSICSGNAATERQSGSTPSRP